jgi:hypothetical protein
MPPIDTGSSIDLQISYGGVNAAVTLHQPGALRIAYDEDRKGLLIEQLCDGERFEVCFASDVPALTGRL